MARFGRFRLRAFGKEKQVGALLRDEAWTWLEGTVGWMPGRTGRAVRGSLYGRLLGAAGPMDVAEWTHIRTPSGLKCGKRVSLGRGVQLTCGGGISIGDDVMFGQGAFVISNGHVIDRVDIPMAEQGLYGKPVEIGDDVWIGAKAIILPGVRIGRGAVIAAGAIVTRDVPDYALVVGSPGRVVRIRTQKQADPA